MLFTDIISMSTDAEQQVEGNTLGGLVEFFRYVTSFDEANQLFTSYTPSYPHITATHAQEVVSLELVKDKLSNQLLDNADTDEVL